MVVIVLSLLMCESCITGRVKRFSKPLLVVTMASKIQNKTVVSHAAHFQTDGDAKSNLPVTAGRGCFVSCPETCWKAIQSSFERKKGAAWRSTRRKHQSVCAMSMVPCGNVSLYVVETRCRLYSLCSHARIAVVDGNTPKTPECWAVTSASRSSFRLGTWTRSASPASKTDVTCSPTPSTAGGWWLKT